LPTLAAVPAVWRRWLDGDFEAFRSAFFRVSEEPSGAVPCPRDCGCSHEVVRHEGGHMVAVCTCDPWNCDDLAVTPAEVVVLELNWARLGRALARAFECDARDAPCGPAKTRQIGSFSGAALPVVLTIQNERHEFRSAVAETVAALRRPFVLLAPTARLIDIRSQELLASCGAGFFDLQSNVMLMPSGLLRARKSGGELFSRYVAERPDEISEDEGRRLYARVLLACDRDGSNREAPLKQVFDLYCMMGFSAQEVAVKLHCAKSTVMNRLGRLKEMTGVSGDKLRAYKPFFERAEASMSDPRARRVRRRDAIYGEEPDGDGEE
jgi:hypothetical protein